MGFFSLNLYRFRHRLFNGEMSPEITREIFERGHAAVLLPYDPVRDEVVGPAGPTTATRMDKFVEPLLAETGDLIERLRIVYTTGLDQLIAATTGEQA